MARIVSRVGDAYHIKFNKSYYMVLEDKGKHLIFSSDNSGNIKKILPVGECIGLSIDKVLNNFSSLILGGYNVNK